MYIYTYIWEYFKNHSVLALYSNFEYNSSNQNLESEQYFIIYFYCFILLTPLICSDARFEMTWRWVNGWTLGDNIYNLIY